MRYLLSTVMLVVAMLPSAAQDRLEFGVMAGGSYYLGEMNPSQQFKKTRPAGAFLARYVYSDRIAFKAVIGYYSIAGSYDDSNLDNYSYPHDKADHAFQDGETQLLRPADTEFKNGIIDASIYCEFNFLSFDHIFHKDKTRFTPYLCAGLGYAAYSHYVCKDKKHQFILSLPFGFGAKYKLNNLVRIGAEWTFHKTFTDQLENIQNYNETFYPSDPYKNGVHKPTHNNDWFVSAGLTLTFSLWPRSLVCRDGFKEGGRL
ncbi:MAG: DUF6089 family protein [Bacteroidales bacterium]|nr:DUF6089 family protein [Bacteroidales bacterium]MDD7725861.1 DUF6089 family protein [Bacteroidales bacterium]MDY4174604.1 DUF6089 family protein [Bacteroidales bacterium]